MAMVTDGLQYTQSILVGLIVSFLLAKLFSLVFSSSSTSTSTHDNSTLTGTKLAPKDEEVLVEDKKRVVGVGDIDDDWEGVETTELDDKFCAATEFVSAIAADHKVSNDSRLKLYGLFKVATDGVCTVPQPSAFKITARAKWNAWHKLGDMSQEEAMHKYLEIITELYPNWADGSTSMGTGGGNNEKSSKDTTPMGPDFSSFVHEEEFKLDAIHDYAREDQTPLHSAVDCGQTDVANILADIKVKDNEGYTPLHQAAVCEPGVKENAATGMMQDDDGTVYPSDLSSNWQSIQPEIVPHKNTDDI